MWKKDTPKDNNEPMVQKKEDRETTRPSIVKPAEPRGRTAKVAHTILSEESTVVGEVKGKSDVFISGVFQGSVEIPNNMVTVELSGKAKAKISAYRIIVHGHVEGNLYGTDTVHVMPTGIVEGDIQSANVILEKACKFNGSIQMLNSPSEAPAVVTSREKPASQEQNKQTSGPFASAQSNATSVQTKPTVR